MTFNGTIKRNTGTLTVHNRSEMERFVASLGHSEKDVPVVLILEKRKSKRSWLQNRYYFALLGLVVDRMRELGHSPEDVNKDIMHEFFKNKFHYREMVNEKTGEIERLPLTTTQMSKDDFSVYLEHIKRWTAEWLDYALPDSNQQLTIE